jgi:hypothetical protein
MRFSSVMTCEQARVLYDLVKEHHSAITAKWAAGVCDGLLTALAQIDRGGGACVRGWPYSWPSAPDHANIIEAAIIPACTYIGWPGVTAVPGSWWDFGAMLPELSIQDDGHLVVFRPITFYRATRPLALIPIEATQLPVRQIVQAVAIVQPLPPSSIPVLIPAVPA